MRGGSEGGHAISVLRSRARLYPNFGRRGSVGDGDGGPTHDLIVAKHAVLEILLGPLPSG
jgi:hypothetical protein